MKKFIYLLVTLFAFTIVGCEDGCTQRAKCQLVSKQFKGLSSKGMITICHKGETIDIAEEALQTHLDHGDYEGECNTLSDTNLEFKDGEIVDIPCGYELPFVHMTSEGQQWWYSKP